MTNAAATPTIVLLGNSNPQMQERRPIIEDNRLVGWQQVSVPAKHMSQSVTRVVMRPDFDDSDHVSLTLTESNRTPSGRRLKQIAAVLGDEHRPYAIGVHEVDESMNVHSAGHSPAWVASSDEAFAKALGEHFGCPVSDFQEVGGSQIGGPTMLLTNGGRDALHHQHLDTAAPPATFTFGALSTNTGSAFAAADTTLAGELTTNGLARKAMTFAHTAGTNTSTLTATWTYTSTTSVVIASFATFNAASVGTMGEEDALSSTATVAANGDSATVTFTATIG